MNNKRKHDRFKCSAYCGVYDCPTDKLLGILVDLSLSGLQIMSEEEICCGPVFKLRIEMHKEVMNSRILVLEAKSIWCKKGNDPNFYVTGLEFQMLDESTKNRIKTYTLSSTFSNIEKCKKALI